MSRPDIVAYAVPARLAPEPPRPTQGQPSFAGAHASVSDPELLHEAPTLTVSSLSTWSMPRFWTW